MKKQKHKVDLKLERLKIQASQPVLEIRNLNVLKDDGTVAIDNLDFFSIEQVIKSQGSDLLYGYTASSSYNVSIFTIILMILSLSVLIFIYISAIIRKGGTK